jgi:hypothetical protein
MINAAPPFMYPLSTHSFMALSRRFRRSDEKPAASGVEFTIVWLKPKILTEQNRRRINNFFMRFGRGYYLGV